MKLLRQLLAVILLVIMMLACKNESKKRETAAHVKVATTVPDQEQKKTAPSPSLRMQKLSPPTIVNHYDTKIELVDQEGIKDEGLSPTIIDEGKKVVEERREGEENLFNT